LLGTPRAFDVRDLNPSQRSARKGCRNAAFGGISRYNQPIVCGPGECVVGSRISPIDIHPIPALPAATEPV